MTQLRACIYVAPPIPFDMPKGRRGQWSPISSTLIIGDKEAVLCDTPITNAQNAALADWVDAQLKPKVAGAPAKKLTKLYITHGHFDHWAGIGYLKKRYPGLQAIATMGSIQHMKDQVEPKAFERSWRALFPGQIDEDFAFADPLPDDGKFFLEGHELEAIEVGHTDTYDSTILWVPAIKLAVCGDAVYGNVHQMLAFANTKELRQEWIRAVEKIQSLGPELVVPGHMEEGELNGSFHLENTKTYIREFGKLVEEGQAKSVKELAGKMLEKYPTRFNEGALLRGCVVQFPSSSL